MRHRKAFGQGEFAVLLVNDALSGGQVKGRLAGFGVQASVYKEVLAILLADFFPGDGIRVAQNNSDTLASQGGTLWRAPRHSHNNDSLWDRHKDRREPG